VAAVLVAIVVATMAGGLLGRRIRIRRERTSGRTPTSDPASRVVVTRAPERRSGVAASAQADHGAMFAAGGSGEMPPGAGPGDRSMRERLAMPGVVGTSEFARRMAAGSPPVASRPPSPLSPAMEDRRNQGIPVAGGNSGVAPTGAPAVTPGVRRRERRREAGLVVGIASLLLLAIGIALGWPGAGPNGAVLDASGTPDASETPATSESGGSSTSLQPPSEDASGTPQPSGADSRPTPGAGAQSVAGGDATTSGGHGTGLSGPASATPTPGPAGSTPAPTSRTGGTPAPTPTAAPPTPSPPPTAPPTPRPTPVPTPVPTQAPTPGPTPTEAPTAAPSVEFSFSVNGLRVMLSNKTKGADAFAWSFGDGQTSTRRNPNHTYGAAGSYNVTLTATADGTSASVMHTVTVGD
jgi:PKD domain